MFVTTIITKITNMSCLLLPVREIPKIGYEKQADAEAKYQQLLPVKSVVQRRPLPTYELFCFGGTKCIYAQRTQFWKSVPIRSISHMTISPITGSGVWKTIKWKEARVMVGTTQIGHKVYVLGGYHELIGNNRVRNYKKPLNVMEVFDCVQRRWDVLAPCPAGISSPAMAALDGYIYVTAGAGTYRALRQTWRYCLATDQWSSLSPMPVENGVQTLPTMVALDGKLYLVGDQETKRLTHKYCPATDQWSAIAKCRYRHRMCSAVAHGGEIYVLSTAGFEKYNPARNRWRKLKSLSEHIRGARMENDFAGQLVVVGDRLLVLGACLNNQQVCSRIVMEYEVENNQWIRHEDMNIARSLHGAHFIG